MNKLAIISLAVALLPSTAMAQMKSKPSPSPTAGFCVNKVSGAARLMLDENGMVQPCRKNEFPVSMEILLELAGVNVGPTPTPSPDATPTSTPVSTPTATPVVDEDQPAPIVVDANSKFVGILGIGQGLGNSTNLVLRRLPDGTSITLPVSVNGFVDGATLTGGIGFLVKWYTDSFCSGDGNVVLGTGFDPSTGKPLDIPPIIQETTDGGAVATYIFNNILYYAGKPVELMTFNSYEYFTDPSIPGLGCQALNVPQVQLGGPVTTFDVGSLGLTPPFKPVY